MYPLTCGPGLGCKMDIVFADISYPASFLRVVGPDTFLLSYHILHRYKTGFTQRNVSKKVIIFEFMSVFSTMLK